MSFSQKRSRSAHSSALSEASTSKPPSGGESSKPPLFHKRKTKPKLRTPTNEKPISMGKTTPLVRSADNLRGQIADRKNALPNVISPELAAKVVKSFLLPMFQNDSRNQQAKLRAEAFGLEKLVSGADSDSEIRSQGMNPLNLDSGTVLSELKLSEQLLSQIQELKDELKIARFMLKDSQQKQESAIADQNHLKDQLTLAHSNIEFFKLQYEQLQVQVQKSEFSSSLLNSEVFDLKKLVKEMKSEKLSLITQLNEEKSLSDKLRNRQVELEHSNHMLKMGSEIMGDHLKGLYEAVESLVTKRGLQEKLATEYKTMSFVMGEFKHFAEALQDKLQATTAERDLLTADYSEMSALRQDLKSQMEKFSASAKERISALQKTNTELTTDNVTLATELARVSKNYKDLTIEHDKFRHKVKTMNKQSERVETSLCRNCQRMYSDQDNFNWSCRVHLSEYNGEMWWCCGKAGTNAPGCKAGKHLPKGDEFEEEAKSERSGVRCSSCREVGHNPKDCPKDPNIRSTGGIDEEMHRINTLMKKRHSRFKTRVELDPGAMNYLSGAEDKTESPRSESSHERREAFTDIDKVKSQLSIHTDIHAHTEETLSRNASFKPPIGYSSSRTKVKKSQVSPHVPQFTRMPGSFNSLDLGSQRSSVVMPSTELSDPESSYRVPRV